MHMIHTIVNKMVDQIRIISLLQILNIAKNRPKLMKNNYKFTGTFLVTF